MNDYWFGPIVHGAQLDEARRLHGRVYQELGFVPNLPDSGMLEDEWTPHSRFFAAVEPGGPVVGTCRLIPWTEAELPTVVTYGLDLDSLGFGEVAEAGKITEVSALATDKQRVPEPLLVSAGLYRAMWQEEARSGASDVWLFSIENWLFDIFKDAFGLPVDQVGEGKQYYGAVCIPVILDLRDLGAVLWPTRPEIAEWFVEGLPAELHQRPVLDDGWLSGESRAVGQ